MHADSFIVGNTRHGAERSVVQTSNFSEVAISSLALSSSPINIS